MLRDYKGDNYFMINLEREVKLEDSFAIMSRFSGNDRIMIEKVAILSGEISYSVYRKEGIAKKRSRVFYIKVGGGKLRGFEKNEEGMVERFDGCKLEGDCVKMVVDCGNPREIIGRLKDASLDYAAKLAKEVGGNKRVSVLYIEYPSHKGVVLYDGVLSSKAKLDGNALLNVLDEAYSAAA